MPGEYESVSSVGGRHGICVYRFRVLESRLVAISLLGRITLVTGCTLVTSGCCGCIEGNGPRVSTTGLAWSSARHGWAGSWAAAETRGSTMTALGAVAVIANGSGAAESSGGDFGSKCTALQMWYIKIMPRRTGRTKTDIAGRTSSCWGGGGEVPGIDGNGLDADAVTPAGGDSLRMLVEVVNRYFNYPPGNALLIRI